MENLNIKNIQDNIFRLLDHTDVEGLKFANLLEISEKQFRLIKKEKAIFSFTNINVSCKFFNISIEKLNRDTIVIEDDLREKLIEKHKNNIQYLALLPLRPSLKHIIRFGLNDNQAFYSTGLIVNDIQKALVKKNPNWDYTSGSISNAFLKYSDFVKIMGTKIVNGKTINIYGPKKL